MKKIFIFITVLMFLTACGGGGSGGVPDDDFGGGGSAPTGDFSGQVDPVQTTNN